MEIYFNTFGSGDRRWNSTVRQILPTPSIINDVVPVPYQVLIDIENSDGMLMDAMTTHRTHGRWHAQCIARNIQAVFS
ncbi:MAG: hypothetical protein P8Y45_11195 [Exilibacterium sp.]